ncbi:MAG: DUF1571 domain-containing protein [Planctomycetaceae bacterium]
MPQLTGRRTLAGALVGFAFGLILLEVALAQNGRREGRRAAVGAAPSRPVDSIAGDQPRHPLDDVIDFAQEAREAVEQVKDYTATFSKKELVGNRMIQQTMEMKFRREPFSVYFHFRSGNEAGREVIYVAGANRGNLVVHEVGIKALAGTVSLRPNDPKAMEENRYPITRVGIINMLETAFSIWESEKKVDPSGVDVKFFPDARLGQTACKAVQITHPNQQRDLKFHQSIVYFDKQTKLPVRAERYDWPRRTGEKPRLIEEYTYSNLRTNVGLTDADFDPRNRNYGFR